MASDWSGVGVSSASIGPRACPQTSDQLSPAQAAGLSGNCSPRSAQSSRDTFSPLFAGPSGNHPAQALLTSRAPSLCLSFPSCQDLKGRGGGKTSRIVFRGASLGSMRVWSLPCRPSGTRNGPAQHVGRWGVCQEDPHPPSPEPFQGQFLSTGPNPNPPLFRCVL